MANSTIAIFDFFMNVSELKALKADYDRDGFVLLPGYLGAAEVDEMRRRAIPLAANLLETRGNNSTFPHLLKSLQRHDNWFEQLLTEGKHVPLVSHLLEDEIVGASAAWFDRPDGEEQGIDPHIDAIGSEKARDAGATIWFALDSVNAANGCVHYLPGSHTHTYSDDIWISGVDTESEDVFAAELEPGDVVIHNALTVHWSGGNASGKPRRAVSCFYHSARAHAAQQQRKMA